MQFTQFVRMLGRPLVLGLVGFVVGCSSGAKDSSSEGTPDAKARQELTRKERREAKQGIGTGKVGVNRSFRPGGGGR